MLKLSGLSREENANSFTFSVYCRTWWYESYLGQQKLSIGLDTLPNVIVIFVQDPMVAVKEKCGQTKECVALMEKLTTCNDRVNSKSNTAETCVEELTDYLHCVDHCVSIHVY